MLSPPSAVDARIRKDFKRRIDTLLSKPNFLTIELFNQLYFSRMEINRILKSSFSGYLQHLINDNNHIFSSLGQAKQNDILGIIQYETNKDKEIAHLFRYIRSGSIKAMQDVFSKNQVEHFSIYYLNGISLFNALLIKINSISGARESIRRAYSECLVSLINVFQEDFLFAAHNNLIQDNMVKFLLLKRYTLNANMGLWSTLTRNNLLPEFHITLPKTDDSLEVSKLESLVICALKQENCALSISNIVNVYYDLFFDMLRIFSQEHKLVNHCIQYNDFTVLSLPEHMILIKIWKGLFAKLETFILQVIIDDPNSLISNPIMFERLSSITVRTYAEI